MQRPAAALGGIWSHGTPLICVVPSCIALPRLHESDSTHSTRATCAPDILRRTQSDKAPFQRPFGEQSRADAARQRFAQHKSDHLAIVDAFGAWRNKVRCSFGCGHRLKSFTAVAVRVFISSIKRLPLCVCCNYWFRHHAASFASQPADSVRKRQLGTLNLIGLQSGHPSVHTCLQQTLALPTHLGLEVDGAQNLEFSIFQHCSVTRVCCFSDSDAFVCRFAR